MSYTYGHYTRPVVEGEGDQPDSGGEDVVLRDDPINRPRAERKGFTYVGPLKEGEYTPGLEPANQDVDGVRQSAKGLDAQRIVKLAADVVMRKITGTWSEAEAVAESLVIRGIMREHGAFPLNPLDAEGAPAAQSRTGPIPTPVGLPAGADVSLTGPDGASAKDLEKRTGAAGAATDGAGKAPDLESGTRRAKPAP